MKYKKKEYPPVNVEQITIHDLNIHDLNIEYPKLIVTDSGFQRFEGAEARRRALEALEIVNDDRFISGCRRYATDTKTLSAQRKVKKAIKAGEEPDNNDIITAERTLLMTPEERRAFRCFAELALVRSGWKYTLTKFIHDKLR